MQSSSPFIVEEHTFEGQHIREYPGALLDSEEAVVHLHAKSYTPKEVAAGDVEGEATLIGFHANGFHKEVYEPFLERLYLALKARGLIVGSIWFPDQANQGASSLLNDDTMANDSHWFDHSRDVVLMVNTFRSKMKRPLVAVGHSMGATQAVATAIFHPRLFECMVLIDPPMTMTIAPTMPAMVKYILSKPETFATRAEAETFVRQSPFFKGWDEAVLQRYVDTAFHTSPTIAQPNSRIKPLTYGHNEIRSLARPNPEHAHVAKPATATQRYTHPDVDKTATFTGPLYNPNTRLAYSLLGYLRPPTQFLLGKGSRMVPADELEHRTNIAGTYAGGSGGVKEGNVEARTVAGGHFLPMTNPSGTAEAASDWIAARLERWRKLEGEFLASHRQRSKAERQSLPSATMELLKAGWDGTLWENPYATKDGGRSKL